MSRSVRNLRTSINLFNYDGEHKIDVILSDAKNLVFPTAMRCFAALNMTGVSPIICYCK
jgi:hypothetical protein